MYTRKLKKKKQRYPIQVLVDDRERKPWKLDKEKFVTTVQRIPVGDYAILFGNETVIIEKKSGWKEFVTNLAGINRERFIRFLKRLSEYDHKYFIIEDSIESIDITIRTIPNTRLTSTTVYYWLTKIMVDYDIPVLLVGKHAIKSSCIIDQLFTRIVERFG